MWSNEVQQTVLYCTQHSSRNHALRSWSSMNFASRQHARSSTLHPSSIQKHMWWLPAWLLWLGRRLERQRDAPRCPSREMLLKLNITPGKPPSSSALDTTEYWARLEDDAYVQSALRDDERERLLDVFGIDNNGSSSSDEDDEVEVLGANLMKIMELKSLAPPPYIFLAESFGLLEGKCCIERASEWLRKVKMALFASRAGRSTK